MSTRQRTRAKQSYTAKLYRHRTTYRPARKAPAWLRSPLLRWAALSAAALPAAVMLAAEAGHLAAAVVEWPAAPARGIVHVTVAALLGLAAITVYFGPTRRTAALAIGAALLTPLGWPIAALAGLPPYRSYPVAAAAVLTLAELAAATLLIIRYRPHQRTR